MGTGWKCRSVWWRTDTDADTNSDANTYADADAYSNSDSERRVAE